MPCYSPTLKTFLINAALEILIANNSCEECLQIYARFVEAKIDDDTRPFVPKSGSKFSLSAFVCVKETKECETQQVRIKKARDDFNLAVSSACQIVAKLEKESANSDRVKLFLSKALTCAKILARDNTLNDIEYDFTENERIAFTLYFSMLETETNKEIVDWLDVNQR